MSTLTTILGTDQQSNSRTDINNNFSALNTDKAELAGATFTGPVSFSGTTNAGLKVNSLTTTQRNALTPANGMVIYNSTTSQIERYENGAWAGYSTDYASMQSYVSTKLKFGGTGADGALAITSGTTTLDLGGAQTFTKNYTSISITGTGKLAFSNPHANGTVIILKSQGDVTLTSSQAPMIDASGMGALYGNGCGPSNNCNGSSGTPGYSFASIKTNEGIGATILSTGADGGVSTFETANSTPNIYTGKYSFIVPGAGGGGGATSNGGGGTYTTGRGGRGGGGLVIECGGSWNFTTTNGISVAGENGADAVQNTAGSAGGGGGGGGGGGVFIALYNLLTANTGTIKVSAGSLGASVTGGNTPYKGGTGNSLRNNLNGYSLVALNTEF